MPANPEQKPENKTQKDLIPLEEFMRFDSRLEGSVLEGIPFEEINKIEVVKDKIMTIFNYERNDLSEERNDLIQLMAIYANNGQAKEIFDLVKEKSLKELEKMAFIIGDLFRNGQAEEILELFEKSEDFDAKYWASTLQRFLWSNEKTNLTAIVKKHQWEDPEALGALWKVLLPSAEKEQLAKVIEASYKAQKQEIKTRILSEVERKTSLFAIDDPDILSDFEKFMDSITYPEMLFFQLLIDRHGVIDPKVRKLLKGDRFLLEIEKSGSRTFVFTPIKKEAEDRQILLVNQVVPESAQVWQKLADEGEIPVAPVYKTGRMIPKNETGEVDLTTTGLYGLKDSIRVFSRFCGISFRQIEEIIKNTEIGEEAKEKRKEIERKIEELGISHGHLHEGNFVIELIDKEYYQNQLEAGQNVNNIDWNKKFFSYELAEYVRNPEKWEMIVRLIDWDQASKEEAS